MTLGIPFPRTSPDHGTAYDIAWKGIADISPSLHALRLCESWLKITNKRGQKAPHRKITSFVLAFALVSVPSFPLSFVPAFALAFAQPS
jgi:hypothetical protein